MSATDPPIPPATFVAAPLKGVAMGEPVGLAAAVAEPVPVAGADLAVPEALGMAVKAGMLEGVEVTTERVIMVGLAVVRPLGQEEKVTVVALSKLIRKGLRTHWDKNSLTLG